MAGSFEHCQDRGGVFTMDMIENMGDAAEAIRHMFAMIHYLAHGDLALIDEASKKYYEMVRGETDPAAIYYPGDLED